MTVVTTPHLGQFDPGASVPVGFARLGSWEISLRRYVHSADDLAAHYDAAAGTWDRTAARFGLVPAYAAALRRARIGGAGSGPLHALDCGIGTGSLTLALSRVTGGTARHSGLDTSPRMIAAARASLAAEGVACDFAQGSITAIPHPDARFDLVMAAHVLEHLPDPAAGLAEMSRVLKPGGRLFACVTRPSLFGAFIQMRWRTWAVSEGQGLTWLRDRGLGTFGLCPLAFHRLSGPGSTAFWATKPL